MPESKPYVLLPNPMPLERKVGHKYTGLSCDYNRTHNHNDC